MNISHHPASTFWQKLPSHIKGFVLAILLIVLSLLVPGLVKESSPARLHKASFYFLQPDPVAVGESFTIELRVKTSGTAINAMGFTLNYNPLYVEVDTMTTENSFCTFYLDNTFDNQKGTVKVSCGMPNPGFLGDTLAVRLTARGRIAGNPAIVADPSTVSILANDGKGSNIVENTNPKLTLNIQQL